jgi:nucleoside-diphosphate-sugar epimerase
MEVLLVGSDNELMRTMINKLNKEGHRCYVLTGNKNQVGSYKNAYEKYRFPYESDCLKEIFDSVRPDVTIFLGVYDYNFDWSDPRKEAVRYQTALQNVLTSFSMLKGGRFIYLSSQEVYSQSYANDIDEREETSAYSFRSVAIVQGEDVCRNYKQMMGTDTVILRLDHLYLMPEKEMGGNRMSIESNPCAKMCIEAIETGYIQANANKVFSLLYVNDAVEAIYKAAAAPSLKRGLYHVSSGEVINEMELAQKIQKEMGQEVSIVDNTVGSLVRVVLDHGVFAGELGLTVFHHVDEVVVKMAKYIKKYSASFINLEDVRGHRKRDWRQTLRVIFDALIPFIENLICFIPFFMLNNRAVGSRYFANLDFYLLYVLLFAIVYGQQQATFSAVLAVGGYCFRQMYNRSSLEVLLDYNTYVWIAQLFILGLAVGYMKDRLRTIRNENKHEVQYMVNQLDDIQDINTSNVRIKNMLEVQLVNQNDSFGKIYEITSSLDQYEPSEVLFYAAEILARLVDSKDVAIYTIANRSYARLFSATSPKARELGNSIEYTKMEDMYRLLKEKRVYINRSMDPQYPLMADAIYAEDEMQLILMVWGIPWERMTLSQANMLVIIGYLIQNAVLRANRYLDALEQQRYLQGTKVLDAEAFESLVKAYLTARNKGLTECTILEIDIEGKNLEKCGSELAGLMRQSDYIGKMSDGRLCALLSNTDNKDAEFVIKRFGKTGYKSVIREDVGI